MLIGDDLAYTRLYIYPEELLVHIDMTTFRICLSTTPSECMAGWQSGDCGVTVNQKCVVATLSTCAMHVVRGCKSYWPTRPPPVGMLVAEVLQLATFQSTWSVCRSKSLQHVYAYASFAADSKKMSFSSFLFKPN